jgi:ribosomal-protein-alanine N-acetyltransferase
MTPDDLALLHRQAGLPDRPWSAAEYAALLAAPGALLTGKGRSFALGRVAADEAEVLMLVTVPAARRLGLARGNLAGLLAEARARGAATAFLEVAEDNAAALALYRAAGFVPAGRRPAYYARPGGSPVAALVLRRPL